MASAALDIDLARVLHEAFYVARTGRPGPVVVDIPKDVQFATGKAEIQGDASADIQKVADFGFAYFLIIFSSTTSGDRRR